MKMRAQSIPLLCYLVLLLKNAVGLQEKENLSLRDSINDIRQCLLNLEDRLKVLEKQFPEKSYENDQHASQALANCPKKEEQGTAKPSLIQVVQARKEREQGLRDELTEYAHTRSISPSSLVLSKSIVLDKDYALSSAKNVVCDVPSSLVFDGNGYCIEFPSQETDRGLLHLKANTLLGTRNVTLKNFTSSRVVFDEGAGLVFGSRTIIELAQTEVMLFDWVISGDVIIRGNGTILHDDGHSIILEEGATLTFDRVYFAPFEQEAFSACQPTSNAVVFRNSTLFVSSQFMCTVPLMAEHNVFIAGGGLVSLACLLTLKKNSCLMIDSGMCIRLLRYADIECEAAATTIFLNGCSLEAPFGLNFDQGTLLVQNKNVFQAGQGEEGIFFSPQHCKVSLLPTGSLELAKGSWNFDEYKRLRAQKAPKA